MDKTCETTLSNTAPECPYCGHVHQHDGGFFYSEDLTEYACEACDKTFAMEVTTTTYWRCEPKEPSHG